MSVNTSIIIVNFRWFRIKSSRSIRCNFCWSFWFNRCYIIICPFYFPSINFIFNSLFFPIISNFTKFYWSWIWRTSTISWILIFNSSRFCFNIWSIKINISKLIFQTWNNVIYWVSSYPSFIITSRTFRCLFPYTSRSRSKSTFPFTRNCFSVSWILVFICFFYFSFCFWFIFYSRRHFWHTLNYKSLFS